MKRNKKMRTFIASAFMCILMSFNALAASEIAVTADDFPNISENKSVSSYNSSYEPTTRYNEPVVEKAVEMKNGNNSIMPFTNQAGEPLDSMYFYWAEIYPLMRKPGTEKVIIGSSPLASINRKDRQYYAIFFSEEDTNNMYMKVIKAGYDLLGWRVKINFRFDFINPLTWTRTIDETATTTENVPQPHNPYQTYTITYDSYFKKNPLGQYSTSFAGSVTYFDKYNKVYKDSPFSAYISFNSKLGKEEVKICN